MNRNIHALAAAVAISAVVSGVTTASVLTGFSFGGLFGPTIPEPITNVPGMEIQNNGWSNTYPGPSYGTTTNEGVGGFNSVSIGSDGGEGSGGVGVPCNPANPACDAGLVCVPDNGIGRCQPMPGLNVPCNTANPTSCNVGLTCVQVPGSPEGFGRCRLTAAEGDGTNGESACVSPSSLQDVLKLLNSAEAAIDQLIGENDVAITNNTPCTQRPAGEQCNQASLTVGCSTGQTCRAVGIAQNCECGGN